jgi:hypothetical protein
LAEYLDVVLDDRRPETAALDVSSLPASLSALLPDGIEVEEVGPAERSAGSLQQLVTSCSWTMSFAGVTRAELEYRVGALLAAAAVPIVRERKGREEHDDLRPSVLALTVSEPEPEPEPESEGEGDAAGRRGTSSIGVVAELATQPRGVRPIELVRGLRAMAVSQEAEPAVIGDRTAGIPVLDRACRTQQWIERDGIREEPLGRRGDPTAVDRAAHALERAS